MNNIIRLKRIKNTIDLDTAIIAAKKQMEPVQKAQAGNRQRMYANIDDVLAAIEIPLMNNNITVYHERLKKNGEEYFKTTVKHAPTGQSRSECRPYIPDSNTSMTVLQAQGSAETYMRRYALNNLLSLRAGDLDKDGNKDDGYNNNSSSGTKNYESSTKTNQNFITTDMLQQKLDLYEEGEKMKELYCKKYKASELNSVKQEYKKAI